MQMIETIETMSNSTNELDEYVMYLIVRSSLNMSVGKCSAQVGHAVGQILQYYWRNQNLNDRAVSSEDLDRIEAMERWLDSSYAKIVKRADEIDFPKVKKMFPEFVITDLGRTEIPAGTETVIGLFPMLKSRTPKLIKRLRLL